MNFTLMQSYIRCTNMQKMNLMNSYNQNLKYRVLTQI